jgi:hypothetical protein
MSSSNFLMQIDAEELAAELAAKASKCFVEDMEIDLKTALKDQAVQLAQKVGASSLENTRDASHRELQALQNQLSTLSTSISRLDTRVWLLHRLLGICCLLFGEQVMQYRLCR